MELQRFVFARGFDATSGGGLKLGLKLGLIGFELGLIGFELGLFCQRLLSEIFS